MPGGRVSMFARNEALMEVDCFKVQHQYLNSQYKI